MDTDPTQSDRAVGSMLSGEQVERLRDAIGWVREHHGLRLKSIALESGVPDHSVRNFVSRKSNRPENAVLGKLYKFVVSNKKLLPEGYLDSGEDSQAPPEMALGRLPDDFIKRRLLPISDADLKRVFKRYTGYYLCFRRSYRPSQMAVSWLHVMPLNPNAPVTKQSPPMPRFTLYLKYPDRLDAEISHSHIIIGYAICRNGRIFLLGHHDGEPQYVTLNEPAISKFTYLQGLCLLTSVDDKQPFATRTVCQYLGPEVSRDDWEERIGLFAEDEFGALFDNADIVTRAIGDSDLLIGQVSD
jgi:hypothetical protein